ncbi:DDE-type integrase/transposase/recombinase [Roseovarius sp. E0-M6]|uniref:DDE-type integrase/transposase/recombinase n=1 Tax=Roseovarius sp. E0-M6 TaxID=3127118 RepID=UPI003FA6FA50
MSSLSGLRTKPRTTERSERVSIGVFARPFARVAPGCDSFRGAEFLRAPFPPPLAQINSFSGRDKDTRLVVDHESEFHDTFVSKAADRNVALKFLRKLMKRHSRTKQVVTDRLRSCCIVMEEIRNVNTQRTG